MGAIADVFGALGGKANSPESRLREYYLNINTLVRAKEGRFKITINDIEVHNTKDGFSKSLLGMNGVRRSKNGESTSAYVEIEKLKAMLAQKIDEIHKHVELVRESDTAREAVIRNILEDDDW